ncbi:hypothetical protein Tco_1120533 [Tanacetum coccineum]
MFILRCQREISEDLRLSREINALCARLTAIVDERENFVDELDILVGSATCAFICGFDVENLIQSEISGVCKATEEKKVRGAVLEESLMCPLNLYMCI